MCTAPGPFLRPVNGDECAVGFSESFAAAASRTMDAFDVERKLLVGCFFTLSKLKCSSSDPKQSSVVGHL